MTNQTIEWLRGLAEKGGKGVVNNIDARSLGCTADCLASAYRRITVLEMIIRQDLSPFDCSDELNKTIVQDIHDRFSIAPMIAATTDASTKGMGSERT